MAAAALGELNLFKIFIYSYRKTLINPPFFIPPPRDYAAGFLTPESSMSSIQLFGFCVRGQLSQKIWISVQKNLNFHISSGCTGYTIFLAQKSAISGCYCSIFSICSKLLTEFQRFRLFFRDSVCEILQQVKWYTNSWPNQNFRLFFRNSVWEILQHLKWHTNSWPNQNFRLFFRDSVWEILQQVKW